VDTVLIFRIGSLGDTVVALPCFHRIAHSFPDSRRIVLTDIPASQKVTPVESVLGKSGLIDGVVYFPPPPRKLRDFLSLRMRIRETKASTLIYVADRTLAGTLRDVYFFRACGIQRVLGAPLTRDLRRLHVDPETGHTEREAERLARCLAPLGPIDLDDPEMWDLRLQTDELRNAQSALAPLRGCDFLAISLGGKVEAKDWGDDNWTRFLGLMAGRYPNLALVFIGSADEFYRAAALALKWPGPTLNLCGRLAPRESAAAMRNAELFIGHDSGPMHLAAAVGIPCVAMFGPVNMPKWWHPMGPLHHIIHNMAGVRAISPADVFAVVEGKMTRVSQRASGCDVGVSTRAAFAAGHVGHLRQ
jgi:ADP-heptose:LPS heptosyltransferase